jgi:SWI/SNF-related matrix-associated actin-dependent regulator 1 of chromatin subfamily A
LVVVPPHLISNWENASKVFLDAHPVNARGKVLTADGSEPPMRVHTITGKKPYPLPEAQIYIIHYLLLDAWRQTLKDMAIRNIVMDEIQELRHATSLKYSAASDLAIAAEGLLGLSGTPIHNYGGEIWNVLNIVEYHCLGDWDGFTREWCNGSGNMTLREPEVLRAHLKREGLVLRRLKSDVLTQLPAKRRVVIPLNSDTHQFNKLIGHAVDLANQAKQSDNTFKRGRLELEALKETRRVTGITKAPAVADFVRTLMESDEPTLLFVHHHAVMDILKEKLAAYNPCFITGRETKDEKAQSLKDFREGKTNLAIIALRSASGLDGFQDRARVVVFAELDWSPAVHAQGEDRAHRMGQKDSVLVYYLVSSVGTDMDMQEALGLKVSQFVGLMGDAPETEKDRMLADRSAKKHMRRLIDRLQEKGLMEALAA